MIAGRQGIVRTEWSPMFSSDEAIEWMARAEEMRTVAETMRDKECKAMALRIAEDYERLARRAEAAK